MSEPCEICVVIPVLNEAANIRNSLMTLCHEQHFREIVIVDGGSTDATIEIINAFIVNHPDQDLQLLHSQSGRARQMNTGAEAAKSPVLLFLHADSHLPAEIGAAICSVLNNHTWGFFQIRIDSHNLVLRIVSQMMCWRSTVTAIATGDQALFVTTEHFRELGGFATIPLMEDIEFCRRLRRNGRPGRILHSVRTSARRWQRHGIVRTIVLMWWLRFDYWRGASPDKLQQRYANAR